MRNLLSLLLLVLVALPGFSAVVTPGESVLGPVANRGPVTHSPIEGLDEYRAKILRKLDAAPDHAAAKAIILRVEATVVKWASQVDAEPATPEKGQDPKELLGVNDWLSGWINELRQKDADRSKVAANGMARLMLNRWSGFDHPVAEYIRHKGPLPAWPVE